MAQYGHNFYGTAYYGKTNAFSGDYTTKEIPTDEDLKSTFTVNIQAVIPDAFYGPQSEEIIPSDSDWTYDDAFGVLKSNKGNASLEFAITCDRIIIHHEKRNSGADKITVQIKTIPVDGTEPTERTETFSSKSSNINTNAKFTISNLAYGRQEVKIIIDGANPSTDYFSFKGVSCRVTHFTIETRAGKDGVWTDFVKINTSYTVVNADQFRYKVSGTSPDYAGNNMIQVRVWMASSDNEMTPEIMSIENIAGNSENRTERGYWEGIIDMQLVATAIGKTFKKIEGIYWTQRVPETTDLIIRSCSSTNALSFGKWTVPYRLNTYRVRLKEGIQEGYIDTPLVKPESKSQFIRNIQWEEWRDQSYLPPDDTNTWVRYVFLDTTKSNENNPYHLIHNPMNMSDKTLYSLGRRNFYVRVRLHRRIDKMSPAVDFIHLDSRMNYTEEKIIEGKDFSAVNNHNTGKDIVLDMSTLSYNPPAEVKQPTYELDDRTNRPQDVVLYYDSEKDESMRSNETINPADKIWAETKTREPGMTTGLRKHYQYSGGNVRYPEVRKVEMSSSFTPSLDRTKKYRYYLQNGWPTIFHEVATGDTFKSIADSHNVKESDLKDLNPNPIYNDNGTLTVGQKLQVPNYSTNENVDIKFESNDDVITDKSSQNALIDQSNDLTSDVVVSQVVKSSIYGEVDWVSDERIYEGIVNPNDVRKEYKRSHITPDSGVSGEFRYIAAENDTYETIGKKFGVDPLDIAIKNQEVEVVQGLEIIVPARITLPDIHPKAYVSDNPYKIDIIYNSVKKADGTVISESALDVAEVSIEYKTKLIEEVRITRGQVRNGKDLLSHPRIKKITKVTTLDRTREYNPYDPVQKSGDFIRDNNYIDWSPAEGNSSEPEPLEDYYVSYECEVPDRVTVTIDTNYFEEGGVDRIWRSPEVKEFNGMCYPGFDFKVEAPPFSEWKNSNDEDVEDFEYVIEDDDLWVKTWIEYDEVENKYYVMGSLQDLVPKDNWFPTIQTGFYYLGKDEYYLYNEPVVLEPTAKDVPTAKNVKYVDGKYDKGVYIEEGSINKVRNSGFDTATNVKTIYKKTFKKEV